MRALTEWIGIEDDEVSHKEKLVSALGGFVSILLIIEVSQRALGLRDASMLIASMGASAVLLFAVPRGQLSQPWPVLTGHVASALIGVTCATVIPHRELAAASAVGLSIACMHQFRFVHPPGGATALTAVIGGPAVTELGYSFVWHPVLLNAVLITATAVGFNWFFPWRRYPTRLQRTESPNDEAPPVGAEAVAPDAAADSAPHQPSHEDVLDALRSLDTFIDITEEDLLLLHHILSRNRPLAIVAHSGEYLAGGIVRINKGHTVRKIGN